MPIPTACSSAACTAGEYGGPFPIASWASVTAGSPSTSHWGHPECRWVEPDGTWEWKDEGDFSEAQALGILDGAAAARVRAEGERVVAEAPWPTGWEDWRPDPAWPLPALPGAWDVVEPPASLPSST